METVWEEISWLESCTYTCSLTLCLYGAGKGQQRCAALWESVLCFYLHHCGSLKSTTVGGFTPWKLADTCQSFYSEEPLFNISLVQSHELTIHGSGIHHGRKLGTPWVFRHRRRINTRWHIFSCTRTLQPGEQTHTITYGKMDEFHRHQTIYLRGYLLCKFQNQTKFSVWEAMIVDGGGQGMSGKGHQWVTEAVAISILLLHLSSGYLGVFTW